MTDRHLRSWLLAAVICLAMRTAAAEVITDGSLGAKVRLRGPDVDVGADLGQVRGRNLFHSFERFDIGTHERVTFTGPSGLDNVISRVTGGGRSSIDGTLRSTVSGADVYLLNPSGVVFGPNAQLDVPASFHVSTADELRFEDGAAFNAREPTASGLTVAAPEAFGFLGSKPGALTVERSSLEVPAGEALSLIGGEISASGEFNAPSFLRAESGTVRLVATSGANEVPVGGRPAVASNQGVVHLTNTLVDASGDPGGNIDIVGGRVVLDDSGVFATHQGRSDNAGAIVLGADSLELDLSEIFTTAASDGVGGPVMVEANDISLTELSRIGSETEGTGDAGPVTVTARSLELSGNSTGIRSRTLGNSGNAGPVGVTADGIELKEGAGIESNSSGVSGDAGPVTVTADVLKISDGLISSETDSESGHGGTITVKAQTVELKAGQISTATFCCGGGDAGAITITADTIDVGNEDQPLSSGSITSSASGRPEGRPGDAGVVTVEARKVTIHDHGRIESETSGGGGTVLVRASEIEFRDGGAISTTSAGSGTGGNVEVEASRIIAVAGEPVVLTNPPLSFLPLTEIASDTTGIGNAGRIAITTDELQLRRGASISSATFGDGNAGSISVSANSVLVDGSRHDAEFSRPSDHQSILLPDTRSGIRTNAPLVTEFGFVESGDR